MNYGWVLEAGTILSILAIVIPVMAAMGLFKSRRQRDLEAALKRTLRQGAKRPSPPLQPLPTPPEPLPASVPVATPAATATVTAIPSAVIAVSRDAHDARLRSRPKAFDSPTGEAESEGHHSASRLQRRYRRTRCIIRNPAKGTCPNCGYLL